MSEPIISVSGLRGIVGESLTPEVAMRYACAFAETLAPGPILISRDGRGTGTMLANALKSGLTAIGRDVIDADVAATPTTGVLVFHLKAAGGIQISASHNPAEYNGLKLFASTGRVIPAVAGEQVIERYHKATPRWATHQHVGTTHRCEDTTSEHLALINKTIDYNLVARRRFKVIVDANHGAGSVLARPMLDWLKCEAQVLGDTPDGRFEHTPEPTAENLSNLVQRTRPVGADVIFCQDPDADRLAVIDENGRYLGEECTLAICVNHVLSQRPGPVVTNCSTSRMTEDLANKYGVPFFRSAVGEANVVDLMLRENALLGGEGNGGVIDPRVGLVRDSFVGMAMILDAMAARDLPVSKLADELPHYEIVKTKVALDRQKIPTALAALTRHFADAVCNRMDGLRLDWPGKWLLVRASNTEPIVRAIAEAPTQHEAQRLCDEADKVLKSI